MMCAGTPAKHKGTSSFTWKFMAPRLQCASVWGLGFIEGIVMAPSTVLFVAGSHAEL